jgi:hypothetical protein
MRQHAWRMGILQCAAIRCVTGMRGWRPGAVMVHGTRGAFSVGARAQLFDAAGQEGDRRSEACNLDGQPHGNGRPTAPPHTS